MITWGVLLFLIAGIWLAYSIGQGLIDLRRKSIAENGCLRHEVLALFEDSDRGDMVRVRVTYLDEDGHIEGEDMNLLDLGGWAGCPYCPEMITFHDRPAPHRRPEEGDWFNGGRV